MNEVGYKKKITRDYVEYTLHWSDYLLADKFTMLKKLNEMTGLYVLFAMNKYKRLSPIILGAAWYSGLRSMAIKLFDFETLSDIPQDIKKTIENGEVYIKYMEIYVLEDFIEIFFKLKNFYKNTFVDTNGLTIPEDLNLRNIRLVDDETKAYHKNK